MQMAAEECLTIIIMQKLYYEIGNSIVGKSEYLLITYKLTEFNSRIEAKYSPAM